MPRPAPPPLPLRRRRRAPSPGSTRAPPLGLRVQSPCPTFVRSLDAQARRARCRPSRSARTSLRRGPSSFRASRAATSLSGRPHLSRSGPFPALTPRSTLQATLQALTLLVPSLHLRPRSHPSLGFRPPSAAHAASTRRRAPRRAGRNLRAAARAAGIDPARLHFPPPGVPHSVHVTARLAPLKLRLVRLVRKEGRDVSS